MRRETTTHAMETTISNTHATVSAGSRTNSSKRAWATDPMVRTRYPRACEDGPVPSGKEERLQAWLAARESVVVAYSGGVDSTFLAAVAHDVLGEGSLAVTADSPSLARSERARAEDIARRFGWSHLVVDTFEMGRAEYTRNAADRCYWCKTELLDVLGPIAEERGAVIVLGTNVDDLGDYRPGQRAVAERGAQAPLVESGLTKDDVRALSRAMGLPTADRPASPCLSSRIAYGVPVTHERLRRIEEAEAFLRSLGFEVLRVRDHDDLARVEVSAEEVARAAALRDDIVRGLSGVGFRYVTLDLAGFRSGSMNAVLPVEEIRIRAGRSDTSASG